MKKFFTLVAAMSAFSFSAMADAVTYQFESHYADLLITTSDSNTSYFIAPFSAEEMDELAAMGITTDTPEDLLEVAADMYMDEENVVEHADEYIISFPEEGLWTVVVASVEEQDGEYVCISEPTIATFDVAFRVLDNPINLTFGVAMNGSELTIIPSDLNQDYIFSFCNLEAYIEEMGEEPTVESLTQVFDYVASLRMSVKYQGEVTEMLDEEPYGNYKFFAAAVSPDEDVEKWGWYRAGDLFVCDFVYGDPSSLKLDVEGTQMLQKAIREGRIVLNGKYVVDGKVIR